MKERSILYALKLCGCMAIVMRLDPATHADMLVKIKRVAGRRGYTLKWVTPEAHAARSWECPEHQAIRVRVAREKVAHQEQLAPKG